MFQNDELKNHLETSFSVESEPAVVAEWNMNIPGNIQKLGNYRYRENDTRYGILPNVFEMFDTGNFYTGATDADVSVQDGFQEDGTTPQVFIYPKDKEKMLYSLEDCLKPFRPRSGINKLSYFSNKFLSFPNVNMYLRPRYYMPNKDDEFKYWRSYRTETNPLSPTSNLEYGISKNSATGRYAIEDTNPFVVYKEQVPANRIVVKVQTNVGGIDLGPFRTTGGSTLADPFFGESRQTVPSTFKIQYLNELDQWVTAYSFNDTSVREDGVSPIFGPDGHLSIEYGIEVPSDYANNFVLVDTLSSAVALPESNIIGRAYLIVPTANSKGVLHVFNGQTYDTLTPEYKWFVGKDGAYENTHFITDFTNPSSYREPGNNKNIYREFVFIKGIRLAVETMNTPGTPLELIEISPRLVANLSNNLVQFDVTKAAADLSSSSLPVGQIMAGTGRLTLFDNDQSFNTNNEWNFNTETGSIIAKHVEKSIKFTFYEVIKNVNNSNYYVPIKTLYSEGFTERNAQTGETSLTLRDFYFYFESLKAPRILLTEVSLSQAICLLLDSVGFSNYVFKRRANFPDPVIPNFFIPPEQSIAETLTQLSRATQSAMFFDEYNNFVVMTKEYILDESKERSLDTTIYGSPVGGKLPSIVGISSQDKAVFNAGTVNFTSREIQRTAGSLQQNQFVDRQYIYKPSLLWEVGNSAKTSSANAGDQSGYVLTAMPLNTSIPEDVPSVSVNNQLINNTIDVGENAYWIARFQGLLYANGEIIRYDAVEYSITGTGEVWISSNLEYQDYFSRIPFNGKIYPTGLVRIFAEPFYETTTGVTITENNRDIDLPLRFKAGPVVSHGRGQFGTKVVGHGAGLDPYWTSNDNIQGCDMKSDLLFNTSFEPTIPATVNGAAGLAKERATRTQRNGLIRNFLSSGYNTETDTSSPKTTRAATMQSSALIMTGPDFEQGLNARDHVSYVHKKLNGAFKHFGTRLRIIGKIESQGNRTQSVVGGMTYLNIKNSDPTQSVSIGGGSAGISLVDPKTNNGYYFEIAALTSSNIQSLLERLREVDEDTGETTFSIENLLFYKIKKDAGSNKAIPIKLWGGLANVLVDDGNFAGQYRFSGEENPTVYDIAIEYADNKDGTSRDFYLYINQQLIARVTDRDPLPVVNSSVALFVRGNAKAMFENIYALSKNYATNTVFDTNVSIAKVFGDPNNKISANEALGKYAISGLIQDTYLSQISSANGPAYDLYFEEFGTIMREAAYFNFKYERAFPALYAKIAPVFNRLKGYTVSGFTADSYGAEFLVFNNTDTVLKLDSSTNNALRVLGVAFTGENTTSITVDDFLKRRGSLSDPELVGSSIVQSPFKFTEQYEKIKQSRILYGKNDFTLDSIYIQDLDTAENLLGWIINKNIRPRKSVGLNIFSMPTLQLGDLVNVYYKDLDGIDLVTPESVRYVVYNINYSRSVSGPEMTVYLSEV